MKRSATQVLLGTSQPTDQAPCYVCGGTAYDKSSGVNDLPDSFTSQDMCRAPWSAVVCSQCSSFMAGRPSAENPPQRMFSHAWSERDGWRRFNKSETKPAWDLMLNPPDGPWFLALAESGQIHVVPFASVNYGRSPWIVRLERIDVASSTPEFAALAFAITDAYCAGFSRDNIWTGEPSVRALMAEGARETWTRHHQVFKIYHQSPLMGLICSLLRQDGTHEYRDRCAAIVGGKPSINATKGRTAPRVSDSFHDSRPAKPGLDKGRPPNPLGASGLGIPGPSANGEDLSGNGRGGAARASDRHVGNVGEQMDLFGGSCTGGP